MSNTLNLSLLTATLMLVGCRAHVPAAQEGAPTEATATPRQPQPSPEEFGGVRNQRLISTLWQQTSAEYQALGRQAYQVARRMLDAGLADPKWTAALEQQGEYSKLAPAIILDIDETVLDTASFQARLIKESPAYSDEKFAAYAKEATSPAIEGVREFLAYAVSKGVKVFYITNRTVALEAATRENLQRAGLPLDPGTDTVIMRGERPGWEPGDKSPRRRSVAEAYRVILLIGDDFNDFVTSYDKSVEERRKLFDSVRDRFGTQWIILPNSIYGSWERALFPGQKIEPQDELKKKHELLRTTP